MPASKTTTHYTLETLHADIATLVDYCWADEARDYAECAENGNGEHEHIFNVLRRLREFSA